MEMRTKIILLVFFVFAFSISFLGCDFFLGGNKNKEDDGNDNKTNQEILGSLGFDLELEEPVDDNNIPVGNKNPMGNNIKSFMTIYEIYEAGAALTGYTGSEVLLEYDVQYNADHEGNPYTAADSGADLVALLDNPSSDWMNQPKKSVAADIDGDGVDEIITAVFIAASNAISFRVYNPVTDTVLPYTIENIEYAGQIPTSPDWGYNYFFKRDFTTGDFNNDGKPDFAAACAGNIITFDSEFEITGSIESLGPFSRVAAGDLNGDSYDDLVLIDGQLESSSGHYYIFAGSESGLGLGAGIDPKVSAVYHDALLGSQAAYSSGEFAVGDLDGDGMSELVFAGVLRDDSAHLQVALIDPYDEENSNFQGKPIMEAPYSLATGLYGASSHHHMNYAVPRVVTGDFDGDGVDEFNVMDKTFNLADGEMVLFTKGVFDTPNQDTWRRNDMFYDISCAGDVTGDGLDDLVFFETEDLSDWNDSTKSNINYLTVWARNSLFEYVEYKRIAVSANRTYPTLTLGNTDSDSLVVQFESRELEFGEPVILAVLASPPYNEYMNIDNSGTAYSITSGSEESWEYANGFNVGVAVGYSVEVSLPVCDVLSIGGGRSVAVEQEFMWGYGESLSKSFDYGFSADAGNDMVIVTAIPVDMYIYEILTAPDPEAAGSYMTINVPRSPEQLLLTVDFYNSMVKEEDRIPDEILVHTLGDPSSYYSEADMQAFLADEEGVIYTGTAAVPQGSGQTSISYEEEKSGFTLYEYSLTASHTYSYRLLFAEAELTGGYNHGYACQHSVSSGFSIEGVVGSIENEAEWSKESFSWGLMMIPKEFNDQSFNLVTYWVK
jgi:hypothetical protein